MISTLIAVPCMDMVHTGFVKSLMSMRLSNDSASAFVQGTLIYEARNLIAKNAISCGFDRVLWLDSDMIIPPDAMARLSEDMDTGMDFVSAMYYRRRPPANPVICDKVKWFVHDDGNVETECSSYINYPENQVFEIAGAGFGCVMTSVDLLKEVVDKYGSPFTPMMGMGEDIAFCWRVTQMGRKMYCDSRIKCGHIGQKVFDVKDFEVVKHGRQKENSGKG